MANDSIDQLNHLIQINTDAEAGFRTAAENVKNSEIESLFEGYAKQHAKFAGELRQEIERLGESATDGGSFGGAMHRGWMDVKAALSGHSAGSMLTACASAERSAEIAYTDTADSNPSGQTHTLIEKQREQVRGFRAHLDRLVGQIKDGSEFQKNE